MNGRGVDTRAYWPTVHIWNGKESVIDDGCTAFLWDNGFEFLLRLAFRKIVCFKIKRGAGGLGSTTYERVPCLLDIVELCDGGFYFLSFWVIALRSRHWEDNNLHNSRLYRVADAKCLNFGDQSM